MDNNQDLQVEGSENQNNHRRYSISHSTGSENLAVKLSRHSSASSRSSFYSFPGGPFSTSAATSDKVSNHNYSNHSMKRPYNPSVKHIKNMNQVKMKPSSSSSSSSVSRSRYVSTLSDPLASSMIHSVKATKRPKTYMYQNKFSSSVRGLNTYGSRSNNSSSMGGYHRSREARGGHVQARMSARERDGRRVRHSNGPYSRYHVRPARVAPMRASL